MAFDFFVDTDTDLGLVFSWADVCHLFSCLHFLSVDLITDILFYVDVNHISILDMTARGEFSRCIVCNAVNL